MGLKYLCDKCEKEIRDYESVRKPQGGGEYSDWLILCKECFKQYINGFKEFMKNGD